MRYVVTGHRGFIGSHLVPALEAKGHEVVGLDIADPQLPVDLTRPGTFRRCLTKAGEVDRVIHLAAQPGRVFGEDSKQRTMRLNIDMTLQVAQVCGQLEVPLLYTSTSEVYGDHRVWPSCPRPVSEEASTKPKNLYGLTKLWGEQLSQLYAPYGLLIARPTMPYGPTMPVGYGRAALPTFIANAIERKPLVVHLGARRSWCYIDDLIDGFVAVIEQGDPDQCIYNIGRDDDLRYMTTVAAIACELAGLSDAETEDLIQLENADKTITLVKNLSTQRLYDIGFKPKVALEDGMAIVYEHLLELSSK